MITFLQILIVAFMVFALYRTIKQLRAGQLSMKETLAWCILWVVIIVGVLIPGVTSFFSDIFGIGRGVDLALYVSIILLFYMIFRIYVKLDMMEHQITKVVREVAIKNKGRKK
ncbi:MAG: DUF2304 family protein [archaeon]